MSTFAALNPILQALLATLFTWGMTAAGAATVFLTKNVSRRLLDAMLGFAAGVMIAASFWSLLAPAIAMAEGSGVPGWIPAAFGFLLGGVFLWAVDRVCRICTLGLPSKRPRASRPPGSAACCWSPPSPCTTSRKGWLWVWRLAQWPQDCPPRRWRAQSP